MSNIVPSNNNQQSLYVQSVEKQKDSLVLRKKLAKEHSLTSISEFVEWWAIVSKDDRRRIMNEEWEYMRDPMIKNLVHKRVNTSRPWRIWFSYKEGYMNGNGDFIEKEEDKTDIIQSKNWIFSAKDGIIIVVDDRSYSPSSRLYTTEWKRIFIKEWRDFARFAVTDTDYYDEFRLLSHCMPWYSNSKIRCYDWRKNIIQGMIPVHIASQFKMNNPDRKIRDIEKLHNLSYDNFWYNLVTKDWKFLQTELGEYYAYPKRLKSEINTADWLLSCVHSWLSSTLPKNESTQNDKREYVFYAIDREWKVFKDEFWNIVLSTNPQWTSKFNREWYALLRVDDRVFSIPVVNCKADEGTYMCLIDKSWKYLRDHNNKIVTNQPSYVNTMGWPHNLFLQKKDTFERKNIIDRWDTKERIFKTLSEDLIIYWYGTQIDHGSPYHQYLNSYGWQAKIINTKINYKSVKFPDGKDRFNHDFDGRFEQFGQSYIFDWNNVDPEGWRTYECVKINWLIARYNKDEDWKELQWVSRIIRSVDEKYLFVQWKERGDYYILNQHFQYIKDRNGEKLRFPHRPPFYVDGMFLYYDTLDWEPETRSPKEKKLKVAYFEDGTLIGDHNTNSDNIITTTKHNLHGRLSS